MHDIVTCHNSKRLRTFLEHKGVPNLKWPGNSPKMNFIANVWIVRMKEVGKQVLCLKEEMWKRVCESLYSVAPNVLEEIYNSMPRRIADHIEQGVVQRIVTLWCRRTGILLCFQLDSI